MILETQIFFQDVRNPFDLSNIVVALASGNVIKSDRVPVEVLPHVVLLTTIGLRTYEQQIVDDYVLLLERMKEATKNSDVTRRLPSGEQLAWLPGINYAFDIAQWGAHAEYYLDNLPDAGYMFKVYEDLINADAEQLFNNLGTKAEQDATAPQVKRSEAKPSARPTRHRKMGSKTGGKRW